MKYFNYSFPSASLFYENAAFFLREPSIIILHTGVMNAISIPPVETLDLIPKAKLPTFWRTPFTKICLGMKIDQKVNFIVINHHSSSLFSLIADGQYRATSLGRDTWKTLIGSQASLQNNCNIEGFNAIGGSASHSIARIGYIANEQNDCSSCDSRIGIGTGGYSDDGNTCGNRASHNPDNGVKSIKVMGYILVQ